MAETWLLSNLESFYCSKKNQYINASLKNAACEPLHKLNQEVETMWKLETGNFMYYNSTVRKKIMKNLIE